MADKVLYAGNAKAEAGFRDAVTGQFAAVSFDRVLTPEEIKALADPSRVMLGVPGQKVQWVEGVGGRWALDFSDEQRQQKEGAR